MNISIVAAEQNDNEEKVWLDLTGEVPDNMNLRDKADHLALQASEFSQEPRSHTELRTGR